MQKLKFSIKTPCNQSWNEMQPDENGRFCKHCSQTVVDFSTKTEEEILHFLQNRKRNTPLCATMTEQQQERGITLNTNRIYFPKSLRKIAAITLIGFSIMGTPILVNGQNVLEGKENKTPKAEAKSITIEVPATFQTIEVQKVKTPPRIIYHKEPAEYHPISRQQLVKPGGFVEWREVLCDLPAESEVTIEIKVLKEKLKEKGFFDGEINNVLTEEVKIALVNFKKVNCLLPAFELDEDTMYLLGLEE